jgi:hypothetical protein
MPTAQSLIRAYVARVDDVNPKERSVVGKINTAALDRFRTVIDPKGVDLSNYNQNRVVLWEHGQDPVRGAAPIGRNGWIRPAIGPEGPELIAKTHFHDRASGKGDEFCERIFECYRSGDLKGFSVRIVPGANCSPPTESEIRARPELADCYMCYRSSELAEYSCVTVPGNQECLTLNEARSVLKLVDQHGLSLSADLVTRAKAAVKSVSRYVMHDGEKWHVIHDGKVHSEHNTREEAEAEAQRIESGPVTIVEHGGGGDDDTQTSVQMPAASLPALTGRSLADKQAEFLRQLRGMFDVSAIQQQIQDRADQARGRV